MTEEANTGRPGFPQFDAEEFRQYVDHFDISEEEKIEYLRQLWAIALTFVDISFGTNAAPSAVSAAAEFSKQAEPLTDFSGPAPSDALQETDQSQQFNKASSHEIGKEARHD